MRTFNKLSVIGITVLMAASIGSARAEEGDLTQTRTHDRTRTEFNLQTPTADFGQSQNREEHTVVNQNQNQNQNQYQYKYQYQNKYQNGGADSGAALKQSKNRKGDIWQGGNTSSMDRMNATNRYMQGSSATGSMNRQSAASRSTSGGSR